MQTLEFLEGDLMQLPQNRLDAIPYAPESVALGRLGGGLRQVLIPPYCICPQVVYNGGGGFATDAIANRHEFVG